MILNLTQHAATADQIIAGVVDMHAAQAVHLRAALTFSGPPTAEAISERAEYIAELACCNGLGGDDGDDPHPHAAMIGGAGYLMPALERSLRARGIKPLHAFSMRQSVETTGADGVVHKSVEFRHAGWVESPDC